MKVGTGFCLCLLVCFFSSGLAQERKEKRPERSVRTHEANIGADRNREKPRNHTERGTARKETHQARGPARVRILSPSSTSEQISQRTQLKRQNTTIETWSDSRRIFDNVQEGVSTGNIGIFSKHMAGEVYLNLRGGERGYYSANQAYYLLEDYFKTRRLVSFDFTTVGETVTNPYATGRASFNFKGSREFAQVYVSLSLSGERWVITQIKIY